MKKLLSLILAVTMAFSIITVTASEEEATTNATYVKYTYDFDESIPEITYPDDKADSMVDVVDNPENGTKALKVTGNGSDWCNFQIDLPSEISTKYVLVKMNMVNETSEWSKYVHINDSDGNTSVRLGYDGNYYGTLYYNGGDCQMPYVKKGNVTTSSFEMLLNNEEHKVYTTHNSGEEMTGAFINESADGVKTLKFEIENVNAKIYYDDIEIIGFDDWSALEPKQVTPANGAVDVNGLTSEISIEYPVTMYKAEASGMNFTVKKNETELTAGTDYTITASGKNVNIVLSEKAGKNATIEVLMNGETVTKFTTGTKNTIEYKYDFDALIPEITDLDGKATEMISYANNPENGTKALKVNGNGNFQIDLPIAVSTKYALVKMNMVNETSEWAKYVHINDSDGNTSVRLGYDGTYYGTLYYNGGDCQMPYVKKGNVTTSSFEMLLNNEEHKVYTTHNSGEEMSGAFINESAAGVKTLKFGIENANAEIYYDDIEIIGFDDWSDLKPKQVTPANSAVDVNGLTSEISIEYPVTMYKAEASGMNFTVKKNETELTAGTDYTITASGNNVNIVLSEKAGKNATIEVLMNGETVTKFTTGTKNTIEYKYDFDALIPEITDLDGKATEMISYANNPANGTKALKVNGNGNFQIDLPIAVSTKYALVKMNMVNETSEWAKYVHINDSDGNTSVRLGYDGTYYGTLYYNGGDCQMPYVKKENVTTSSFEMLLNNEEHKVYTTHNSGEEMTGAFINESAAGVKTLKFGIENANAEIYYDDIEIIGFDDWSDLKPENVTPANGAVDVNGLTSEISIEYPVTMYKAEASGMNFTVKKNETELTAGTDYTITASGNNVNIVLSEKAGKNATIEVLMNGETVTKFTTGTKNTIEYKYDFDALIPEITDLDGKATAMISYADNPENGTKALKVTGNGSDGCKFQIDLPSEISTKYVLVKMNMVNDTSEAAKYVHINDINGNTSVRLGYDSTYYGILYFNGRDCQMPYIRNENVTVSSFEMLLNNEEHKVYTTHSSGDEMTGAFINEAAAGVKTLKFEIENANAEIYYDDIEIIGFDDMSAIEPSAAAYTITGITCDGATVASLAEAAGKTMNIAVEKSEECALMVAIYYENTFIDVAMYSDGVIAIEVPEDADTKAYTTKILAWNTLADMTPIMEAKPIFE